MSLGIWSWLIRWSEVLTNVLDLLAFVLASPEIIGKNRIDNARDQMLKLKGGAVSYWPILIFIYSTFLLIAGSTSYYLVRLAFEISLLLGILCGTVVAGIFLYFLWGIVSLSMMQDADVTFGSMINLYEALVMSVFSFTRLMTPRGMLYSALVLFLTSRVLSVVHAVAVH